LQLGLNPSLGTALNDPFAQAVGDFGHRFSLGNALLSELARTLFGRQCRPRVRRKSPRLLVT
jgi:hypothetical protein